MSDRQAHEMIEQLLELETSRLCRIRALDLADEVTQIGVLLLAHRPGGLEQLHALALAALTYAVLELLVELAPHVLVLRRRRAERHEHRHRDESTEQAGVAHSDTHS